MAALATLIAFVLIVELLIRVVGIDSYMQNRFFVLNRALDYPDVFMKDRDLFWRFRPDREITSDFFEGRTYHINSLGLRGDEVPQEKTRTRIITLGNSCTFGWGVADGATYAEKLGEVLGENYEVINGGIPGYSTFQGRRFFEQELIRLEPDVITIMFGWNDQWASSGQIPDRDQEFPPKFVLGIQNAFSRLHSYRLLKKIVLSVVEKDPDSLFDRRAPVYRVGIDEYYDNIRAICALARERGIQPILLTQPDPALHRVADTPWESAVRFHERYNLKMRQLAADDGLLLVDIAERFDTYGDLFDDPRRDFIHFNAAGHELIGRLIALEILGQF